MQKGASEIRFAFQHRYVDGLPGFYVECAPVAYPEPRLLQFNEALAEELGLERFDDRVGAEVFSGSRLPDDARPVAQAYAGHQFGGFVPQLGDGRALLLGEVRDRHGTLRDIAFKGSGPTPFSRGGDGKAAVGPVLREYLIGEAMHALGIPTTRALAAVSTGEQVVRERPLPGAVLTRVAASHIRVGTFEFFAARQRHDQVKKLADYAIACHDPDLSESPDRYLQWLQHVVERQASLVAKWMLVGFIHGVMNTDNMAVSGETIDYGPCAFLEIYQPWTVFSSIDRAGRYAYRNQPTIARWNLARLAETLLPVINPDDPERAVDQANDVVSAFMERYQTQWLTGVRRKLGVLTAPSDGTDDESLAADWLELLAQHKVDYTLAWRRLAGAVESDQDAVVSLFPDADVVRPWLDRWRCRLSGQDLSTTAAAMREVNPVYIPRNHLVEGALAAASEGGDMSPFRQLLEVVSCPYEERVEWDPYAQPAPAEFTACYKTFCGT